MKSSGIGLRAENSVPIHCHHFRLFGHDPLITASSCWIRQPTLYTLAQFIQLRKVISMIRFAAIAGVLALGILSSGSAMAQNKTAPAAAPQILATVNGEPITDADIEAFYLSLPAQLQQVPLEQIRPQILERLIDQKLVADAARKLGLDKKPAVRQRMIQSERNILNQAFLEEKLEQAVTEQKVRAAYEKATALESKQEEIRARHILVKTENEAKEIIANLNKGADFIELAKKRSTGPSGKAGGDLGYFGAGQMVPPFSRAAFALQKGEITQQPVQTQFGWHVIMLVDRRMAGAQSYESIAPKIREELVSSAYEEILETLRRGAKIDIKPAAGSKIRRVQ